MKDTYYWAAAAPMVISALAFAIAMVGYLAGVAPKYISDTAALAIPLTFMFMMVMLMFETRIRRGLSNDF